MEKPDRQYEVLVYGRVQGVGFRYAAQKQARSLGLKGWVENLQGGSVRIQIRGDSHSCTRFLQWCRTGPAYGWVESVDINELKLSPLTPFRIRR